MDNFLENFKEFLLARIPRAKAVSGGKEVLCRCPFCLDSRDPRSAHFYISVNTTDKPPMYFCQKCQESGIFDVKTLRMFDIYDSDMTVELATHNKSILSRPGNRIYRTNIIHKINNLYIADMELAKQKLKYINDRLGTNMTYREALDNKIVFNLYELLDGNGIRNLTRQQYVGDILQQNFLGFLSYDNGFINMRNIRKPGEITYGPMDKRYVNYNIFNNTDNSKRHYVIPTQIDLLNPNPIEIHLAEGPFDALGILYNVLDGDKTNRIIASIGGRSYINLVKFFVQELGLINIILHIYVDGDVDEFEVQKIADYLNGLNVDIFIHRNGCEGEKDFGVPRSKIINICYPISRRM